MCENIDMPYKDAWEYLNSQLPIKSMIVIGSNTSDNGQSRFTEDVSHFKKLRQNRQLALLKRSAKNEMDLYPELFIEKAGTLGQICLLLYA